LNYLFLGYGNIDRQDDGVAWHLLRAVMQGLGCPPPDDPDVEMPIVCGPYSFAFQLQLTPELADSLGDFDKVCFMDAHTGNVPDEVHIEKVSPHYQSSPFTHHMTASTLLSLCEVVHQRVPATILVSVRGYEFKFTRSLSSGTAALIDQAAAAIIDWAGPPQE